MKLLFLIFLLFMSLFYPPRKAMNRHHCLLETLVVGKKQNKPTNQKREGSTMLNHNSCLRTGTLLQGQWPEVAGSKFDPPQFACLCVILHRGDMDKSLDRRIGLQAAFLFSS